MRTMAIEKIGPNVIENMNDDETDQRDKEVLVRSRLETIERADSEDEKGVLRWGGLAGMMGAVLFILTAILLLGFSSGIDGPEGLIQRYTQDRTVIAIGESIYLAAVVLWVILFLGLYRALKRTSAAPALFGASMGLMGLIALAIGALPNIAFAVISDLYHAPGATAEEQAQLVQIWQTAQGIFNETDTVGFILMAVGFVVLGLAMLRSHAFGKRYGMVGVMLGVVVAAGMLVFGVDSILSFPFVLMAFILMPLIFGRKLYKLSKTNPKEIRDIGNAGS